MMAGRPKEVDDSEFLREFVLSPDPVLVASEVADELGMTRQGAFSRLEDLEEEGYLKSAMKAGSRVWWITPEGREQLKDLST